MTLYTLTLTLHGTGRLALYTLCHCVLVSSTVHKKVPHRGGGEGTLRGRVPGTPIYSYCVPPGPSHLKYIRIIMSSSEGHTPGAPRRGPPTRRRARLTPSRRPFSGYIQERTLAQNRAKAAGEEVAPFMTTAETEVFDGVVKGPCTRRW